MSFRFWRKHGPRGIKPSPPTEPIGQRVYMSGHGRSNSLTRSIFRSRRIVTMAPQPELKER